MFDTHCHLNASQFKKELDSVIKEAKNSGVDYIVVPGYNNKSSKRAVEIAITHENIFAAVGLQPTEIPTKTTQSITDYVASELTKLKALLNTNMTSIVAIGEIGLNRYEGQNKEIFEIQTPVFISQLLLAGEYNKSVIIHNRGATDEMLQILNKPSHAKAMAGKAVFHCCEADDKLLSFAQEHQIYIGVDGDITYSKRKQEFIQRVPLEILVVETDAPYLLPRLRQGYGGQMEQLKYPNTPSNLKHIVEKVAEIKNITKDEVIQKTVENGKRLFRID